MRNDKPSSADSHHGHPLPRRYRASVPLVDRPFGR
jgi:hypothetical protein